MEEDKLYQTYMDNIGGSTITKNNYLLADSYNIQTQNMQELCAGITGGLMLFFGETGSGKTCVLKEFLAYCHKNYDKIIMMSRTAKLQKTYDFFPREDLYDDYKEEVMEKLFADQKSNKDMNKPMKNILVLMDDIITSPAFKKSKIMEDVAVMARHLHITVVLLSQIFKAICPGIRNNVRIAVAFQIDNAKERKKFISEFLSTINDGVGDKIFKNITSTKYQCIVIHKHMTGAPITEKVKKFIADPNIKLNIKKKTSENSGVKEFKDNSEYVRPKNFRV